MKIDITDRKMELLLSYKTMSVISSELRLKVSDLNYALPTLILVSKQHKSVLNN